MKKFLVRSVSLFLVMIFLFGLNIYPVLAAQKNTFDGSKVSDYRAWSQDQLPWGIQKLGENNEYGGFNYYGCLMTAFAKIAVQTGTRTVKTVNPGIVNETFTKGKVTNKNGEVVGFDKAAALLGLTYEGKISYNSIMTYLKKTDKKYAVILKASGHYMPVDKETSIAKNKIYYHESWKSNQSALSTSESKTKSAHSTRYGSESEYLKVLKSRLYSDNYKPSKTTAYLFSVPNLPSYVVTVNPNGGTCSVGSVTAVKNKNYYSLLPTPTRKGYRFKGWYTSAKGGTKITDKNATTAKAITLYAQWEIAHYTVTLNTNNGSGQNPCKSVTYGAAYGNLPTPKRDGYTFKGWYTAASGGTKIESSSKVSNASDHTLYAQWNMKAHTHSYSGNVCKICGQKKESTVSTQKNITITAPWVTNLAKNKARINSKCSYVGTRPSEVGVLYGTSKNSLTQKMSDKINFTKNPFNVWYDLKGLKSKTTYYYKIYVIVNGKTQYSDLNSFTTK